MVCISPHYSSNIFVNLLTFRLYYFRLQGIAFSHMSSKSLTNQSGKSALEILTEKALLMRYGDIKKMKKNIMKFIETAFHRKKYNGYYHDKIEINTNCDVIATITDYSKNGNVTIFAEFWENINKFNDKDDDLEYYEEEEFHIGIIENSMKSVRSFAIAEDKENLLSQKTKKITFNSIEKDSTHNDRVPLRLLSSNINSMTKKSSLKVYMSELSTPTSIVSETFYSVFTGNILNTESIKKRIDLKDYYEPLISVCNEEDVIKRIRHQTNKQQNDNLKSWKVQNPIPFVPYLNMWRILLIYYPFNKLLQPINHKIGEQKLKNQFYLLFHISEVDHDTNKRMCYIR